MRENALVTERARMFVRQVVLAAALAGFVAATHPEALIAQQSPPTGALGPGAYVADFDSLWEGLRRDYAYWDAVSTNWGNVRTLNRPRVELATNREEFLRVLSQTLGELYDPQVRLLDGLAASARGLGNQDIWADWRDGRATVTEVLPGSTADRGDVEPGMEVLAFNGTPVEEALAQHMPSALSMPDPAARDAALRALLAATPGSKRTLEVQDSRRKRSTLKLDDSQPPDLATPATGEVVWKTLSDGFGYVTVQRMDSLDAVAQFDAALERLRSTPGLILDLRQLPEGGSDAVVRGVLGRLVSSEGGYVRRSVPAGKLWPGLDRRWIELVSPRGAWTYTQPVVALVGRWTAGAAEDLAIGLDGMKRATVVGTRMAGLHGAVRELRLPNTGVGVQFPAEKPFHLDGTPRESFVPPVEVDVSSEKARNADDPVLDAGLETLRALARSTS